jgi:hypothetical protein
MCMTDDCMSEERNFFCYLNKHEQELVIIHWDFFLHYSLNNKR